MPKFTPQQLDELYHQTLAEFAASPEKWTSFLDTAARLYKYDFKSQVLIWSQRPDATACAELPLWNDRLHRRVNRGSNGIGIVDNSSNQPRIKYLFDISDTSPRDQSVAPPYIWQMRNDAYDTVLDGISAALGENMQTDFDFPINLYLSAQCFADKKASEYTDNTDLIRIAVKSTAYCVLRRCGFDPTQYSSDIPTGNLSPDELALVGQITQEASETALRSIEQSMKNLDGCKLFRFTTRKRIAEQPSMLYNKGTERVSEPTKEGAVIDGKTAEESILPRGTGRQDAPRSGKAGVRRMGRSASEVHEAVPAGGTDGVASELRAEPLSEQAGSPRDGQIRVAGSTESEASWRDRGTERTRPDAVDRSDGQHSARSDADNRGNLHLLNSQTAAEPEKPAAVSFEQMSLTDTPDVFQSNTQPAAEPDVFQWNTPDVSDEVINRVLTAGSNSTHSRERIAAFFMQPNISMADAAAFLRREYRIGGAGVRVHNIDHSLWFDSNGLRIARGHDTRTPRAVVLTYEDAANRISTLLKNGQYASAAELTDAKPNEYRELASEIWHTYHDMSEEAREQGFFAQTKEFANDVFPPAVEKLTAALSDPAQRTVLTGEMADYARAVQQNSDLCRFHFNVQRSEDAAERLQRTEHMTALYAAADGFEPVRAAFITQDEIDEMLRSGSGIERGKKRISEFYAENHTQKERIEFLKNEYGWGGRAYGGYSENHDGKGITFERSIDRTVYDRITLSWSQVDHQISTLIRQNRYLTPEEQRRYAQERTDTVTISEPENVFQSNTQNEPPAAEPDDFSDIDPIAIREALAERGIVNGKVVDPEKLNRDPFIQRVMADVGQTPQADVLQSNTQKQQAPVDTLNDYNSIKLNASYADSIVLFQVGDFFEMFGEDAKQAAALLELNLTTRELPGTGRVEMCGIPAHSLERYVEKLRDKHDVTIAATKGNSTERHVYTMRSIDHEAEDAINAYETEFGADGLRAFRDTSAGTQANVFQSNTRSAEPTQPKQFIAHFYVAEDIQKRGALDIKEFHSLEDALNAYHKLPNNQRKALGAMNTEALPGSLDFVQCVDGKDTIIQDYTKVAGWQNAEVLNSIAQIERSLNTREAVSVPAENVFQSNTPEEPDSDRYEIYQLTADPANAKLLFTSYDGIHAGGMTINRSNYELKYSAPLTPDTTLDNIYDQFNINRPADFTGHSLSVSDIVVLHRNGQDTAHYVDSIGFADVPEFLTEQTQENVFQRNTPPERDVFEGNSPAERAELAASDPDNDVFDGNTLTEAVQSAEAHTAEDSDLKTAKQLINDYCIEEFDTMADFSDLSDVGLAYSTTEDDEHEIQVSADLNTYCINYAVDGETVHSVSFDSLHELNDHFASLYFDAMISDAEYYYYELHPNEKTENVFQSNTPADNSIMVRCEWSESSAFEDGKVYPLAEFDRLMRKADEDFVSGRENIEQKYGSLENAFNAGYEEAYQYAGYNKTKFTLLLPDGRTFTERQDIGDGDGGLLDFLSQYPAYNDIMPMLREAAGSMPEPENVFHWNTQDYHAGDTVYLDGRPFEITEIGKLNIQLRDPAQPYPIFRSESRESLARLMAQDERNAAPEVFQSNTQETAQTDGAQPVSIMIDGKWTEFPSVQEAEKASLEEYRNALRRNPPTFHITDDNLGNGTLGEKFDRNLAAVRLLKSLEAADRPATAEEQQVLSQYVGWGGMASAFSPDNRRYEQLRSLLTEDEYKAARASVLNAHYTSPTIIRAIYDAAAQFGFENGKILEPSMGVGNFFGMLPERMKDSQLTGVELDSISGRIARKLYPNADIKITGYENTKFADNSFDCAVGNVPFGDYSLHDKRYDKEHLLIHDYFFVKSLDKVRPGGVVAFVTSKGTLDKANPAARRLMAERADLLGAIRLPNTAFKANAGASVTTDILFLQKRDTPPEQLPAWTETGKNADGMELNNYFLQHPEMILGTMQEVTTQYGKDTACVPDPNVELEDLLSAAVLHLGHENVFQSNTLIEDDVFQSNTQEPPAPETADVFQSNTPMEELRPFSYAVQDGKLMFKEADGNLVPSEMNATAVKRAISMIGIRDAVRNLIEAQRDGCDDEQFHALQADLTQNYDTFVKEFGNIHKRGNKLAFRKDAGYPLLLALEKLDDEQNVIGKTAIFSKRTISPHIVVTHADTPEDALGLSLAERGKIDFAYMSALLDGMPQEQITTALRQQIFLDPQTQEWQPADEYLSGNVRAKLDIARLAAQSDPDFAVNVQMLERVQPEPLTAADINVKLGTTWIPPEDIDHFIRDVLHPPFYALNKIKTSYSDAAKLWYVSNKSVDKDPHSLAYTKYGTSRVNAYELLELSLNLRDVQVSDVKIIDGKEKRIPNTKETIKARNAQDALRQAFKDWVFDDPARRERLVGYYNEHFNTTRPREFDGSHLTLPGINPSIQLYSHQKDAVARILYGGNALLAHCVGAGKTWTMAAAAMELRRLGLSHKPMFVVPNSLTEQWGTEFQQLYPGANILVATEADFTKENRKAFCARIATGDYDAVIIGHTQFEKIPLSSENERRHIERQLDTLELSLTDAKRNKDLNFTVKRLESSKKKLETRLEKLMDAKEKDDVVTFEELGVDRLFVDEADEFKNLALFTKMRNVGGINTSAAQKSEDMLAKCEYLNEKTDYHGVCFATGTPVSNSMTELYTMMRYLQNDTLESVNMTDFDSWASNFGETVTAMELAPEGTGYRTKTRFAKFCNLPELINLWRQAADIQTADMLDLQRPEVEYHNVKAQPTAAQQAMVQELGKRADRVRSGAVAPYEDNMLAITNDGRKLALDQRLADSSLPDNPGSKLNMVVENVFNTWESSKPTKGTQLIFCDLATPSAAGKDSGRFCSYDDIRDKLIAKGVPADQIAYIHDADTPAKKNALSSKMKSGAIRVLIGSTAKMGAGFNVQERLVALHHVDCPWRPRDVEQRDGRILRQGNTNEKVHIYRYVTEGTFDSYNWQTVENKQKFISQVVTGKSPARTCDDIDDAALSYAEVKALAAGDPEIKERMELDVYVQKLSVLRTAYHNDQYKLEDDVNVNLPHSIVKKENMIAALKRDQATLDANHAQTEGATFRIELNGKTYTAKDKAGEALLTMIADERRKISQNMEGKLSYDDTRSIGSYCGFKLELKRSLMDEVRICIHGATKRMVEPGDNVAGCIQRMNNAMNDIGKFIGDNEQSLARLHEQLDEAKVNLGKPWPLEDEYQQKISRLNELNYKLTRHSSPRKSADLAEPEL
jgi:N12 class adenine-specific DNA methylase